MKSPFFNSEPKSVIGLCPKCCPTPYPLYRTKYFILYFLGCIIWTQTIKQQPLAGTSSQNMGLQTPAELLTSLWETVLLNSQSARIPVMSNYLSKKTIKKFGCYYYAKIYTGCESQLYKLPSLSVCQYSSSTLSNNKSQKNLLLVLLRWTLPSPHYTIASCLNLYSLSIC